MQFRKSERKDDIAAEYIRKFKQEEGVLFIGEAQEKTRVFRTERRRNPKTGVAYPWLVRSTAMVNHYYIYGVDRDFGPFFLKFCTYFAPSPSSSLRRSRRRAPIRTSSAQLVRQFGTDQRSANASDQFSLLRFR